MPILKKTTFKQNLEQVSVLIKDTDPLSKYFKITKLPDTFTGGKNAFLIAGSPQLVGDTIVKIEIKDAAGNPVYTEPASGVPEYYEGTSKVVAVHIYPDTAFGPATITILGELSHFVDGELNVPIPAEWRDKYNVRWQGAINIHPYAQNTTPIRFYRRPKIEITEEILPIYNRTVVSSNVTGHINGTAILPIQDSDYRSYKGSLVYELSTTSSFFSQSMEGFQIDIAGLASTYKPTITDVTSETKAFVNVPYFITSSGTPTFQQIKNFSSKPFTLTYDEQITLFNSNVSSSFARIKITDLETFTGDAARIKVYASSQNDLGDYQLLEDTILESTELMRVDSFAGALNVRTGIFSQQILDTFWRTEPIETTVTPTIDNTLLIKSVKLEPTVDINSSISAKPLFRFYHSGSFTFNKFTQYQLDFTPLMSSSLSYASIDVYASGSAFIPTDRNNDFGKLITTLETNKPFLKYDKQQINFQPDQNGTGTILFIIKGGKWQIGNVSLAASQESSFSPNEIILTVNVPTKINNETFDFKFELYDINNNYVPIDLTSKATFTGGNDVNIRRALDITTSNNYFNFSADGAFPSSIFIDFTKTGLTGSVTFESSAIDTTGNQIIVDDLNPTTNYPGLLTYVDTDTVRLDIENFTASLSDPNQYVGSITYTASCEDVKRYFNIFRVQQGAPAYLFYATADKNTFGFNPDDNNKSLIPNDFIDIRLVKQNLPEASGLGFTIISGSTSGLTAPPLYYQDTVGNAEIYRLYSSASNDTLPSIDTLGYTYFYSQSVYNFEYPTLTDGTFTSSIVIDTFLQGTSAKAITATADKNQFFYKMNTLDPTSEQTASILVKRQNLGSYISPITVTSGSGKPALSKSYDDITNGVATYVVWAGSLSETNPYSYKQTSGSTTYTFSANDLNGATYSDEITINPVISNSQISVTATKEAVALPAQSTGTLLSSSMEATSGSVQVKVGSDTASPIATGGSPTPNTFTTTLQESAGVTNVEVNSATGEYSVGGLTADSGSITLAVNYTDGTGTTTTTTKTVTYIKTKKAAPTVALTLTNNNQSIRATSLGNQIGNFTDVVASITENYDNATNNLTITTIESASSAGYPESNITRNGNTLSLGAFTQGQDQASITITAKALDSEGVLRTTVGTISLAKVKQAAPLINLDFTPAIQTIKTDSRGSGSVIPLPVNIQLSEDGTAITTNALAGTPIYTNGFGTNGSGFSNGILTFTKTASEIPGDSGSFYVTVSGTNSEGSTIYKYVSGSVVKVKDPVPVTRITVSNQSQVSTQQSAGVFSTPSPIDILIGDNTSYTYNSNFAPNTGDTTRKGQFSASVSTNGATPSISSIAGGARVTPGTISSITPIVGRVDLFYRNSEGTYGTNAVSYSIGIATSGSAGAAGAPGESGPGIIYRGAWLAANTYYYTSIRRDVVFNSSKYWTLTNVTGDTGYTNTTPPSSPTWTEFTSFAAVATDILLAADATIYKGLTIGTQGSDSAFLRSNNATGPFTGKGFWLSSSGDFRIGDDPSVSTNSYLYYNQAQGNLFIGSSGSNAVYGFIIDSGSLYNGKSSLVSTTAGIYLGTDGISLGGTGTPSFTVTRGGGLRSTSGSIGGWSIGVTDISSSTATGGGDGTALTSATGMRLNSTGWISTPKFTLSSAGNISATAGNIGGWNIGNSSLSNTNVALYSSGSASFGSGDNSIWISANDSNNFRLWVGSATPTSAPFRVTQTGALTATNVSITGGTIAGATGWTIGTNSIYNGKSAIDNASSGVFIGTGGIALGAGTNPPFKVLNDGTLTATSATITGAITATSGYIGTVAAGFSINSNYFVNGTKTTYNGAGTGVYVGTDGIGLGTAFTVSAAGALTATSATITGTVTATNGKIGGWEIDTTTLTGSNVILDNTGIIKVGTTDNVAVMSSADTTYRLWVGNATAASAPFRVTQGGQVTATNITISGSGAAASISASFGGGSIGGGFSVKNNAIYNTKVSLSDTNDGIYIGTDGIALGYDTTVTPNITPFSVTNAGTLTAKLGTIGAWTLDSSSIYSGTKVAIPTFSAAGNVTIDGKGYIATPGFYVDTSGNAYFSGSLRDGNNNLFLTNNVVGLTNSINTASLYAAASKSLDDAIFTNSTGLIDKSINPSVTGLYMDSTSLGYWDNGTNKGWKTYIGSNGNFFLSGSGTQGLTWNSSTNTLAVDGRIVARTGLIGGWGIGTSEISSSGTTGGGDASFTSAGMRIGGSGYISAKNMYISSGGDVVLSGSIAANSGFIGGWIIASGKLNTTNVDIDSANEKIDIRSGATIKTTIKTGNANVGQTSTTSVTVPGGSFSSKVSTPNTTSQPNYLFNSITPADLSFTITAPSTVNTSGIFSILVPTPAMESVGTIGLSVVGNATGLNYGMTGSIVWKVGASAGASDYGSGTIYINNWNQDANTNAVFSSTTPNGGAVTLPGVTAGWLKLPLASTTPVANRIYYVTLTYTIGVGVRVGHTSSATSTYTVYSNVNGWSSRAVNSLYQAVLNKAEYATNGLQIGNNLGNMVSIGDSAGTDQVGLFVGDVSIYGTLSAAVKSSSDKRAKYNIQKISNSLDLVKKLNPVSFNWLQDITRNYSSEKAYGFIADDIEEVLPELVSTKKVFEINDFKHLDYTSIHGISIAAIQELLKKIQNLEEKIKLLENYISGSI